MSKVKNFEDLTKAERLKRWQALYDALGRLTPHERKQHWNMETWGEKTPCGTVACAAGHAGFDPKIQAMGFRSFYDTIDEVPEGDRDQKIEFSCEPDYFFGDTMANEVFTGYFKGGSGTWTQVRRRIKTMIGWLRAGKITGGFEDYDDANPLLERFR